MARLDLTGADVSPAICEDIVPDGEYLAVIVRSHLRWTRTRKGRYIQLVVRIIDGDFEGFQIVDRCYVDLGVFITVFVHPVRSDFRRRKINCSRLAEESKQILTDGFVGEGNEFTCKIFIFVFRNLFNIFNCFK